MNMRGMGCTASTVSMVGNPIGNSNDSFVFQGTDCDSLWYYTWPPCWSQSRQSWANICKAIPGTDPGNSDTACDPTTDPTCKVACLPTDFWCNNSTLITIVGVGAVAIFALPDLLQAFGMGGRRRR